MEDRGLEPLKNRKQWVDEIASRKVDIEDFEEVLQALRPV